MTDLEPNRRNVLGGIAAAGLAVPLLAACGSSSSGESSSGASGTTSGSTGSSSGSSGGGGGGAASGGIKTSEIPVGSGKIFPSQKIVVTQPKSGEFKAFSAICTHQGCPVTQIRGGRIDCTCHGSQYSIEDGSVQGGPAPRPLPEKKVTVTGDTLTVS